MKIKEETKIRFVLALVVFIGGLALGAGLQSVTQSKQAVPERQSESQLVQAINALDDGDSLEFVMEEDATGSYAKVDGEKIKLTSADRAYLRLGMWGLDAVGGAAKDQGITDVTTGDSAIGSVGSQHGFGVLEQFWVWVKDTFWTVIWVVVLGGVALGVMSFIPATAGFARTILRGIAGVFPLLGSIVENIRGRMKEQKKQKTIRKVVIGGSDFLNEYLPEALNDLNLPPAIYNDALARVKQAFRTAQKAAQDEDDRSEVKRVLKGQ